MAVASNAGVKMIAAIAQPYGTASAPFDRTRKPDRDGIGGAIIGLKNVQTFFALNEAPIDLGVTRSYKQKPRNNSHIFFAPLMGQSCHLNLVDL